ncbi:hypothetical protein BH23ACT9_BH23ACT9_20870 [soil metagenome]
MTILTTTPAVDELGETLDVLRTWQHAGGPIQLHPGDIGWFWREGAEATAAAIRRWRRDGRILAVGLLDEPELLRVAIAPEALADADLTRHLCADVAEPERGVLPPGEVFVEASTSALLHDQLGAR